MSGEERKFCYIRDDARVHVIGEISRELENNEYEVLLVDEEGNRTGGTQETRIVVASDTFPIDSISELTNPPSDLIQLENVHGPSILHTLHCRFNDDEIYTSIGPILIACNPFRWIDGLYDEDLISSYFRGEKNQSEHPHVFATAHDSLMGLQFGKDQSLIISGESGAGKTEATKQCLNYIAAVAGSKTGVHNRILQANPILESWGNAKTLRNNNSSRFGKFIEILIASGSGEIVGSSNTTYLLEKSRVVFQEEGERNYHIFYQLLFGSDNDRIEKLKLGFFKNNPDDAMCINQSGCMLIEGVDDKKEFCEVLKSQDEIGFSEIERDTLLQAIAGLFHLRNIDFIEDPEDSEGSCISPESQDFIENAGYLFGLEMENFTRALLYKAVRGGGRRSSVSYKKFTPGVAIENRNALAKEIYRRCFDYIVEKINSCINAKRDELAKIRTSMIGILDIFGFEIFKKNSFEQLCINLANEALQKHFNTNIFEMEMSIYVAEDIKIPDLAYQDNQDVLDLVIKKPKGLIPMLDEEGQIPRGSWEGFLRKFTTHHSSHPRLKYRQGKQCFSIVHYAGDVTYDPSLFITKNKDTLSPDLSEVMHLSTITFISDLFDDGDVKQIPAGRMSMSTSKQTVGTNFRIQLDNLIKNLNSTSPKYIRCIKPNSQKKSNIFDSFLVNEQLTYSGVFEAVLIMQNGYPFRLELLAFKHQYHMLVDFKLCRDVFNGDKSDREKLLNFVDLLEACNDMFSQCHVGKTMVFYRAEQHRLLEKMRREKVGNARCIIQNKSKSFVVRNLYSLLVNERKVCSDSIVAGQSENIRKSADRIVTITERMNAVVAPTSIVLDPVANIAVEYAGALELEKAICDELVNLTDDSNDIFDVFDSLEDCVRRAKQLDYCISFQNHNLSVNWKSNQVVLLAIEKVKKFENIISVQKNLKKSLSTSNDVELGYWLEQLKKLRELGEVNDDFCRYEEDEGRKIVLAAEREFDNMIEEATNAINAGTFMYSLESYGDATQSLENLCQFQCEVNDNSLNSFLSSYLKENSNRKVAVRTEMVIDMCQNLAVLRKASRLNNWENVFELLPKWASYAMSGSDKELQVEMSRDSSDEALIPVPEFTTSVGKEIRSLYDCCISKLFFPNIVMKTQQMNMPSTLSLDIYPVDISEAMDLIEEIRSAEYLSFMSELHQRALDTASEKLRLFNLVSKREFEELWEYVYGNSSRLLSTEDDVFKTARIWVDFFSGCLEMWNGIGDGVPPGEPGSLRFADCSSGRLHRALEHNQSLNVLPRKNWEEIMNVGNSLLCLWDVLVSDDIQRALELIESFKTKFLGTSASKEENDQLAIDTAELLKNFQHHIFLRCETEFLRYQKEIVSRQALNKLMESIHRGSVEGEVGCLSTSEVSVDLLKECLIGIHEQLILTEEVTRILDLCKPLIKLRQFVIDSNWEGVLSEVMAVYEMTSALSTVPSCIKEEFVLICEEAHDVQIRKKLIHVVEDCALILSKDNEVFVKDISSDFDANISSVLRDCVNQTQLSSEAEILLNSAILLSGIRKAISDSFWEDESSLKGVETKRLSYTMFKDYDNGTLSTRLNSLLKPMRIQSAPELELNSSIVADFTLPSLSVERLLSHGLTLEIHNSAKHEVNMARQGLKERKCRLLLILPLSSHQICGSLENIEVGEVKIDCLLKCIEFVKLNSHNLSGVLHYWLEGAMLVLNFRMAFKSVNKPLISVTSYFNEAFLRKCNNFLDMNDRSDLDSSIPECSIFPCHELKLAVTYVYDCLSISSLSEAISLGRPQFYENKFDTKLTSYSHLLSEISSAKNNPTRSDKLDRLMFYAELCVFLRQALLSGNWESSVQSKTKRGMSVRQCVMEYDQAKSFFKTPMKGIPPPSLDEEFHITRRELDRQRILLGFSAAFQSGRISGTNGNLLLHDIKYQRLVNQVEKSKDWSESSGIVDFDLELCANAAREVIHVRKRAVDLHRKYKSEINFPVPSNSLRTVLQSGFVSDAMSHAIKRVESLTKHPLAINTEWQNVEQSVSNMTISSRLRSTQQQVQMLESECFERNFIGKVLFIFHGLEKKPTGRISEEQSRNAATKLNILCKSYDLHRKNIEMQANNSVRPNPITEFLFKSAIALFHLLHAEANNMYDVFERGWRDQEYMASDLNRPVPPSFRVLSSTLDDIDNLSFSVQCILRSVLKWSRIHPDVDLQIRRANRHIEDEITFTELSTALIEGRVSDSPGGIDYSAISLVSIRSALERAIDNCNQDVPVVVMNSSRKLRSQNGMFRFSTKYSANEVAHIERQIGFKKVQGRAIYMKIVYNEGSSESISTALKKAASHPIERSDIVRLRHTCELIYELREAIRMKDFNYAYNILFENVGGVNCRFQILLDQIYRGQFSLHHLGVEEFSFMAFQIFERYCCLSARQILTSSFIEGSRTLLNLFAVNEPAYKDKIKEIFSIFESLINISKESAALRKLCFSVNHLREAVSGVSTFTSEERELSIRRRSPIGGVAPFSLEKILDQGFIEDSINNALLGIQMVQTDINKLSTLDYRMLATIQAVANDVEDLLSNTDDCILSSSELVILRNECHLVKNYCSWNIKFLSLRQILSNEMIWYSFSKGCLAVCHEFVEPLRECISEIREFVVAFTTPAEKTFIDLLSISLRVLELVDVILTSEYTEDKDKEVGSDYFDKCVKCRALELLSAVEDFSSHSCASQLFSSAFSEQMNDINKALHDHNNVVAMNREINDTSCFSVAADDVSDGLHVCISQLHKLDILHKLQPMKELQVYSLKSSQLKKIVCMQIEMRLAVISEQLGKANELCLGIMAVDMPCLHNREISLVREYSRNVKFARMLQQGIMCCTLPSVAGWSNFVIGPSLALAIVDYPLRQTLDEMNDTELCTPLLQQLHAIGGMMLNVIGTMRRQVWNKLNPTDNGDQLSKRRFVNLFSKDMCEDASQATDILMESFESIFMADIKPVSASESLASITSLALESLQISESLKEFLIAFVDSAKLEQDIFELCNFAMSAIHEHKICGMPGSVHCASESVQLLDKSYQSISGNSSAVDSSPWLRRILQSLKLLKLARSAIVMNDWSALGPILDVYVYMRSLDKFDTETNGADFLHHEILSAEDLLNMSQCEFDEIISNGSKGFKSSIEANRVNALSFIDNIPPNQDIMNHAQNLLGVDDFNHLLQSIPELEPEMKLLNNHYCFEKAGHYFDLALSKTPASGSPGDLRTEDIEFEIFYEVSELLQDNGLFSYPSGMHLHICCLAMVELRLGQRSKRMEDVRSALNKLKKLQDDEATGDNVQYLGKASAEINLAQADLEQQDLANFMYNGLLNNRLPAENSERNFANERLSMERLSTILKESKTQKATSSRNGVLYHSLQLLLKLWESLHLRAWNDLKEIIATFDLGDFEKYDAIILVEVERAQCLLSVSYALELAEEGIQNGRVNGSVDDIDINDVAVDVLTEAVEAFKAVKPQWKTNLILSYEGSCSALLQLRECVLQRDWSRALDVSTLVLLKHDSHFVLVELAHEEVELVRGRASYLLIETTLVNALVNGRMDGDVGETITTAVNVQLVEDALQFVSKFDFAINDYSRLVILRDTAQLILDLRRSQLADKWMLDPSRTDETDRRLLPDPDTMAVTMSLVPLNWLASAEGNIMKNIGMAGLTTLMQKYLSSSEHLDDVKIMPQKIRSETAEVRWFVQENSAECLENTNHDDIVTVENVVSRAFQSEDCEGLSAEAIPELAFAREEINHRHIVQMLLAAMTSQGFRGRAGKLDGSAMDLHPLERAIIFAENDIENSDRGKCKWMLRDAKLLFKARKFRAEKRWAELNNVLVEVAEINMHKKSPTAEKDEEGNAVVARPILPFAWKEISLIQADMHFYTCLSEFAQEMTNRSDKYSLRSRRKGIEAKSLTGLLRVLLRTLSAAELNPSVEFDRLLEAEHVALELRTHMTFDSHVSPREVILKVLSIRDRDKRNQVASYICLLMPDISRLSDVLDTEQLVESLENSITKGQSYLRAALGFIDGNDIDLESMRSSIHTAMPLLNLTGSKEHLGLLSVATAILAIRTEVVASNWTRVAELLEKHDALMITHEAILSEEISRLRIEIENDSATRGIENALKKGRCKDVYELVSQLSRQRRNSVSHARSGSISLRTTSQRTRASISLNSQQISAMLSDGQKLTDLDMSIEAAMQVRNRSVKTTTMLRAAVLIRSLRHAINTGNWEEVQAIIDEESSYMRFPLSCQEEIKAVKAALSYRSSMTNLSKGLLIGTSSGMPGELNVSNVDCIPLEEAMKQTRTLEIYDPATMKIMELGSYICDLRRAVLHCRWFAPIDSEEAGEFRQSSSRESVVSTAKTALGQDDDDVLNSMTVQNNVPFGGDLGVICEDDEDDEDDTSDATLNKRVVESGGEADSTDILLDSHSISSEKLGHSEHSAADEEDFSMSAEYSVEELLTLKGKKLKLIEELRQLLDERSSNSINEKADQLPEWIEVQLKAVESVEKELELLEVDLNERRRIDILVSTLETVPLPTREFNQIENAPSLSQADGSDASSSQKATNEPDEDVFLIKPLQEAIERAREIPGEMMKETIKIFNTAELILSFRQTMKSMEIENFKDLLTKAKNYSNQGKLSLHYGLYELNSYRSATMTVTLTKAELLKSLENGRVSGPLSNLSIDSIETEALEFWVSSCNDLMGMSQELLMGLVDAYEEAKVMLELRKSVIAGNWADVNEKLELYFDQLYKFEFGAVEIKHIQYASKYRAVAKSINDILGEEIPSDKTNLAGYILPRMEPLDKAILYGNRIIAYQAEYLHRSIEETYSRNMSDSFQFERLCRDAQCVYNLWKSILSKVWHEDLIASGQVHRLPRPTDPLLNVYFESVRQHEVSQRLCMVHEQLAVLNLNGSKKIKNLRSSVRMSLSVMNARHAINSPEVHESLSIDNLAEPNISEEDEQASVPVHHKRNTLRMSSHRSVKNRNMSIGGLIADLVSEAKPKASKRKNYHRSTSAKFETRKNDDVPSVAKTICQQKWSELSEDALRHFENARNILIDKSTILRVQWGCKEGCATETSDGDIFLNDLSVELLEVALADCRRIGFYSQQTRSDYKFSYEVEMLIRIATILLNTRKSLMENNVDELMTYIRSFNELSSHRDVDVILSKFPEVEQELRLFEKFSHEYVAENVLNAALTYLSSLSQVDSKTISHKAICDISNLDRIDRPVKEMTQFYQNTAGIAKMLRKALISSVMCNQYALREMESKIFRLIGSDSSSGDTKVVVSKIFGILRRCSSIRFVESRSVVNTDKTIVSRRHSLQSKEVNANYISEDATLSRMYQSVHMTENKEFDTLNIDANALANFDVAPSRSLPLTLLDLILDAKEFDSPPRDIFLGSTFYLVPTERVDIVKSLFINFDSLCDSFWQPGNQGVYFDPLWILVGSFILTNMKSSSLLLSESNAPSLSVDGASLLRIKAFSGDILSRYELLHHSSYEFLVQHRKLMKPGTDGPKVNLTAFSSLMQDLLSSTKIAQAQLPRNGLLEDKRKRTKSENVMSHRQDCFELTISKFQSRVCSFRNLNPEDNVDVSFSRERFQKRLLSTCQKLMESLRMSSDSTVVTRCRQVRNAIAKRHRQFDA